MDEKMKNTENGDGNRWAVIFQGAAISRKEAKVNKYGNENDGSIPEVSTNMEVLGLTKS